jgi:hypothetical protein
MVPRSLNNSIPRYLRKVSTNDYNGKELQFELDPRLSYQEKALMRSMIAVNTTP